MGIDTALRTHHRDPRPPQRVYPLAPRPDAVARAALELAARDPSNALVAFARSDRARAVAAEMRHQEVLAYFESLATTGELPVMTIDAKERATARRFGVSQRTVRRVVAARRQARTSC